MGWERTGSGCHDKAEEAACWLACLPITPGVTSPAVHRRRRNILDGCFFSLRVFSFSELVACVVRSGLFFCAPQSMLHTKTEVCSSLHTGKVSELSAMLLLLPLDFLRAFIASIFFCFTACTAEGFSRVVLSYIMVRAAPLPLPPPSRCSQPHCGGDGRGQRSFFPWWF